MPSIDAELKLIETCLKVLELQNILPNPNLVISKYAEDILGRTMSDLDKVTQNEGYNPMANKEAMEKGEDSQIRSLKNN